LRTNPQFSSLSNLSIPILAITSPALKAIEKASQKRKRGKEKKGGKRGEEEGCAPNYIPQFYSTQSSR